MGLNEGRKPGGRKTEASISETIQTKVAAAVVAHAVAVAAVAAVAAVVAVVDVALVVAVVASKSISAAWTASQNMLRQIFSS